jgi:SAM-dependent methyltransferase
MGVLRVLSQAVGASGHVVGLDNDRRLLEAAGRWTVSQRMTNVELVHADAFDTGLPRATFDLVHARFLFCPLGLNPLLLRAMIQLTRPGGVIAIQEPIAASWQFYPRCDSVERLTQAIVRAFAAGGGNFNAGGEIFAMLNAAGLADVQVRSVVHALPPGHPYRRLPVQFAISLRQRILDAQLLSERELDDLIIAAEAAAADPRLFANTFTLAQAWGRKP